ncbi:Leishmanolysin [Novymonas esmeraldas]|uniref:Leishmanolysin-like peptidase n=1 Tax=Novymonas esmeraldas TaxID=1808958 RepID=A0AAW0F1T4_9TRYP
MELEDVGGDGTAGSHWKRRSAKDELMAGSSGAGIYSAITIAAMEDLGYYKGNYSMAEPMMYGRNAGCGLVTDKCVVNGVSQIPEMFCASASTDMVCTSDRLGIGYCTVSTSTSALPPYFQYFSNPTLGGNDAQMDYCPYVQAYSDTNCTDASGELIGIMYGVMSRCLDTPGGIGWGRQSRAQYGLCAEVQCGDSTYGVKVSWETEFTPCTPGASLSLPSLSQFFSDGTVTCPSYESVCAIRVDSDEYEKYRRLMWGDSAARASTETAVALAVAAAVLALLVQC